ncbi:lysozyme-like domain-containing protein [Obelidium mucronatum]|nr:lysozyme-like domain-containing protein [Obelidium mucronatum]
MLLILLFSSLVTLMVKAIGLKPEWKRDLSLEEVLVQERDLPVLATGLLQELGTNCSAHTFTAYMNDCQYIIMIKLTSYFEKAQLDLPYAYCSTENDGQGISAGFASFKTCQGAVLKVCEDYNHLSENKTTFCSKYTQTSGEKTRLLENAIGLNNCPREGRFTPPGLETFCTDWEASAKDLLFQQAQLQVQKNQYFEPIESYFEEFNITSPLAIAQLFDSSIQLGPIVVQQIAQNATARLKTPRSTTNESIWLEKYLDAREFYLKEVLQGVFKNTTYRLDAFRSMLKDGNWYFEFSDSIRFTCWGLVTDITPFAATTKTYVESSPQPSQNLTTVLEIVQQDLIVFAASIMMQGIFLGMSTIFLYQAVELYRPRRSWLTFANIIQLLLWITRTLIIIVFNVAPHFLVDCTWRQYASGFVSQAVILCVWWLQYIKFQSMYQNRPWVCHGVLLACVICSAVTFPYIGTTLTAPKLDRCAVKFSRDAQSVYIAADVFINALISVLFGAAIMKHVNNTDKSWDSYAKLSYILSCDVRGSFLDTAAQLVKLFLQLAVWLPSSQTQFGSHICDFIKVLSAHWFVNDVVKNSGDTGKTTASLSQKKGGSKQDLSGLRGSKSAILVSTPGAYSKKDGEKVVGSAETINFQPFLLKVMANEAGRPLSKSNESLRAESGGFAAAGSPIIRGAKSSDNIKR